MSYETTIQEHLRITILKLLEEDPDYTLNESLVADLTVNFGFNPSRDRVRTELSWLQEQGLVKINTTNSLALVTLTERGSDVAKGRVTIPGIKRPSARR